MLFVSVSFYLNTIKRLLNFVDCHKRDYWQDLFPCFILSHYLQQDFSFSQLRKRYAWQLCSFSFASFYFYFCFFKVCCGLGKSIFNKMSKHLSTYRRLQLCQYFENHRRPLNCETDFHETGIFPANKNMTRLITLPCSIKLLTEDSKAGD